MGEENINPISKHVFSLKNLGLTLVIFILGAVSFAATRFILVEEQKTHYHANFALYINGERDLFDSFVFYEEVSACTKEYVSSPKSRVHMHDNKNDLVHVHDNAVTWGHFFSNLGYTLADGVLIRSGNVYSETSSLKFSYILNGQRVSSISDKLINSGDTLLISYGSESDESIKQKYSQISNDSLVYNEKPDPSSCSGSGKESIKDRFIRTILN